jgi:hypothetical protein
LSRAHRRKFSAFLFKQLKELLVEIGVFSNIRNNYKSGIEVGFVGSVISAIDLCIQQSDYEKTEPIIRAIYSIYVIRLR